MRPVTCTVCRRRQSGSTRAARGRRRNTVSETVIPSWVITPGTTRTLETRHILLAVRSRMRGVCMTCTATCLSGVRTGTAITRAVRRPIRLVLHRARTGCTGAAVGSSAPSPAVRRPATGARLTPRSTTWGFVCSTVPSSKVAGGGIMLRRRSRSVGPQGASGAATRGAGVQAE